MGWIFPVHPRVRPRWRTREDHHPPEKALWRIAKMNRPIRQLKWRGRITHDTVYFCGMMATSRPYERLACLYCRTIRYPSPNADELSL